MTAIDTSGIDITKPEEGEATTSSVRTNFSEIKDQLDVIASGDLELTQLIAGEPGTEGTGININGTVYDSQLKVSDIDNSHLAELIIHRHSTSFQPLIIMSRSNTDDSSHSAVTAGQVLSSIYSSGWTGSHYDLFGESRFSVGTGTISSSSSPGKWTLLLAPDGSNTPAAVITADSDKSVTFAGQLDTSAGGFSDTGTITTTDINGGTLDGVAINGSDIGQTTTGDGAFSVMRHAPPSTSGTDTYTVTLGLSAYGTGEVYYVNFATTNTSTTPTLNADTLGAKTIKRQDGTAVRAGDLDGVHELEYDGTDLLVRNPVLARDSIELQSPTATTSGTSHDYTGIPSWVKEIKIPISGISTNGTSPYIIQIGDSGGLEVTGYSGTGASFSSSSQTATNFTSGFPLHNDPTAATVVIHGTATITLLDESTNTWSFLFIGGRSNTGAAIVCGGSKSLSSTLDRLRLTTVGGADTFDAGSFNIMYN